MNSTIKVLVSFAHAHDSLVNNRKTDDIVVDTVCVCISLYSSNFIPLMLFHSLNFILTGHCKSTSTVHIETQRPTSYVKTIPGQLY